MSRRNIYPRKLQTRQLRQRFLITCEGCSTEVIYFKAFRLTSARIKAIGMGMNTISLVEKTIAIKESYENNGEEFDQVWCVMDKDNFPDNNFNRGIKLAKDNNINIAYSNLSFELWYLLHFQNVSTQFSQKQLETKLTSSLGRPYRKSDNLYLMLKEKQEQAITRAKTLDSYPSSIAYSERNPNTTVFKLVEELNKHIL